MPTGKTDRDLPLTTRLTALSAAAALRGKGAVFKAAMSLPEPVVRRLAGRPVVIDGNTLSPHTQLALRLQRLARERGAETLPLPKGRAAVRRHAAMVGGVHPVGRVEERTVAGAEGELPARLYVPRALVDGPGPDPLLVFFHGGGMIYGDLDSHDALCRFLAERAEVRVLAVDYRLAPEHPFPAGVEDAAAAYEHVVRHAAAYGADPDRLAVGGDSAGGYLSATTAIAAAERGLPLRHQLLIYPLTDMRGECESRRTFGEGYYLTTGFMELATQLYMGDHDRSDPRASVLLADLPEGLAPAFVATGGFDPLRDEGEAYTRKLAEAGVEVQAERYAGEIHGFANILGVDGPSRRAITDMADVLRKALV
ncbi:alpha/beta hydrolase [Nocardioides caldifontis]|uniref:alpha/beta hydrolase n=1 Tax=Nocardioides caldifontis TaxID=2588938 RepID=UPI0011DF491A|nr:alpha/beta hydrolase [Nocardioides caldifontis]